MNNPLQGFFNNQPIQNGGQNFPFGNIPNLLSSFNEFKRTFTGDPRRQVQDLINSGRMSPEAYSQLEKMAQQFMTLLK